MIFVLRGGLGNQLFILGESLSNQNSCIEDKTGFIIDTRYKRELEIFKLYPALIYRKCKLEIPPGLLRMLIRFFDNGIVYPFNLGYHQRSSSLRSLKDLINFRKFDRVVIHMRLTDYSLSYSKDAEKYIKDILNTYASDKYVVTDDYHAFVKTFPLLADALKHYSSSSVEDWRFIAESKVAIISDSSFSFTSAFLGCDKEIYHPELTNISIDFRGDHVWKELNI